MNKINDTLSLSSSIVYKTPPGTRDYIAKEQFQRDKMVKCCKDIFKLYNTTPTDTPIFELSNVLKKGEQSDTSKQTFDIDSNLTLRYDQTMPLARYIKQSGTQKIRRSQIGYVFRKDQPNMANCRYTAFLQCDYDNIGTLDNQYIPGVDSETLILLYKILIEMDLIDEFTFKLNTKQALFDLLEWCGFKQEYFVDICRILDKIDKIGWKNVEKEIIELHDDLIDLSSSLSSSSSLTKLQSVLNKRCCFLDKISFMFPFLSENTKSYIDKLCQELDVILNRSTINNFFRFDISMCRGLDYYTGLIFEVNMVTSDPSKTGIGSVAGGGRYDGLCGKDLMSIGFSLGIDRLLKFCKPIEDVEYSPDVWVIQTKDECKDIQLQLYRYRMWITQQLRNYNVSTGTEMNITANMNKQIRYANSNGIKWVIILGTSELKKQTVILKSMKQKNQNELKLEEAIDLIKSSE